MTNTQFWSSRTVFILAVVGSAIGLGNIWRFPYVAYENGGGAFLIPYLIALLTAGIPLLILETGIGYKTRSGAPLALKRLLSWKAETIGWIAVIIVFLIVTYYAVIIAWSVDYVFFSTNLAWGSDPGTFFFENVLAVTDSPFSFGSVNLIIAAGMIIAWVWIYIAIYRGVRSVEKMVWWTVSIPWLLIIIFVIRGLTLPGSMDGLAFYLTPDFSSLLDYKVWIAAYGQIFYSLSLGMAVIIAYSRFLNVKSDVVTNGIIIAVANSVTSILAGMAVFSTLGYLALQQGVAVTEVVSSGIGLVFITYPAAISALPIFPELFGILFFLMLITLGIDSAFSLVEAITAGLIDYIKKPVWMISGSVCLAAFLVGLLYTTGAGLHWLDIIDHYINFFLIIVVGLFEALLIGFAYGPDKMRKFINRWSDWKIGKWWNWCIMLIAPFFLAVVLALNIWDGLINLYKGYPFLANLFGWLLVLVVPALAFLLAYLLRDDEGCNEYEMME